MPFYYIKEEENMRRVMSDELIEKCYSIAKKVFENQLTKKEGVDLLVKNNMREFSAIIYIDVYCSFRKGTLFDRTINKKAYYYYLNNIYDELGDEGLKIALQSLKKLLVRRERDKPAPPCIYKIYDEFQEKLTKQ